MNTEPIKFGARLRTLRRGQRLTQTQLAERVCVSDMTICNWEKMHTAPNMWNILELCKFFNVSSDWLIGVQNDSAADNKHQPSARTLSPGVSGIASYRNGMLVRRND